jgi:hypothetical protein
MTIARRLSNGLLVLGLSDWVHFGQVAWLAVELDPSASLESRIDEVSDVIGSLVEEALCSVGTVTELGFQDWCLPADIVSLRIRQSWLALEREPLAGDIGWLSNTLAGDAIGRKASGDQKPQLKDSE